MVTAAAAPAILALTAVVNSTAVIGSTLPAVGASATPVESECVIFFTSFWFNFCTL